MNQVFSFNRWWLLVGKHWSENRKRYTLSILAFAGLMSLWFIFLMLTDETDPVGDWMQIGFYFAGLFIIAPFYASQFYRELSSKPKGINYLLTPASAFEKLLTGIIYSTVFFLLTYTAIFYIIDVIVVSLANMLHPYYNTLQQWQHKVPKVSVVNVFDISRRGEVNPSYYLFLIYCAVQAFCLLGSVYFPKYSYIKLVLTLCLLCLAIYFIEITFVKTVMQHGSFREGFNSYTVYNENGMERTVKLASWIGYSAKALLQFGFPVVFWLATYFRLREKEI